jgi:hypothetical protein
MKDLQNLLNQVSIITKKNAEFLDATGSRFNMFRITGVNHYENTHSSILAELLNPKGTHGLKSKFLQLFVDQLITIESLKGFHCENAKVKTEAPGNGRIDILIDDSMGQAIIIENKIYASDQWEQLKRYNEFANQKYRTGNYEIFYLTLNGTKASMDSAENVEYSQISYSIDIINWLDKCVSQSARYPLVRETIIQYINHLKQLTNQDMDLKNQEELLEILSKPENIESALKIGENINKVKNKLIVNMAKKIADECSLDYVVWSNFDGMRFYKKSWKDGAGICFASDNGKTYYSLKTDKCSKGEAIPQVKIDQLFYLKADRWNPYGYEHVLANHWSANNQLFIKISDGSLADETIIPRIKGVLEYLKNHPEIEESL